MGRKTVTARKPRTSERKVQEISERIAESCLRVVAKFCIKGAAAGYAPEGAGRHAALFLKMLSVKFGPVPPDVQKRVEQASLFDLVGWAGQMISAATLEDALAPVELPPPSCLPPRPRRRRIRSAAD
jgi:hypothetical protein